MKLRNKKTGEIEEFENITKVFKFIGNQNTYDSLAELNKEWEDYEEPKEYWCIDWTGGVNSITVLDGYDQYEDNKKEIGNYFETKEEAERAVEKLKAWKRLKDNGFKFEGIEKRGYHIKFYQGRSYETDRQCQQAMKDLDLLFGGENE